MKIIRKILALIVFAVPPGTFVGFLALKGISTSELGMLVLGVLSAVLGLTYTILAVAPEKRLNYIVCLIGLIILCTSTLSLILGIVLVITPITLVGGKALWKTRNK